MDVYTIYTNKYILSSSYKHMSNCCIHTHYKHIQDLYLANLNPFFIVPNFLLLFLAAAQVPLPKQEKIEERN